MLGNTQNGWLVRGFTLVAWMLVAGCCVYWAFKLGGGTPAMVVPVAARPAAPADPAAVARLLGATAQVSVSAPVANIASRFALVGVVARQSRGGAALISVDGKPARPYRVGTAIDEGVWLSAVEGRRAVISASVRGPAILTLELPALSR